MKKLVVMMAGLLIAGAVMAELKLAPLPANQAAMVAGNQEIEFTYGDLTPTTAGVAQTNTFTVTGPAGLRFEGAVLVDPFDDDHGTAKTNNVTFTLKIDALTVVNAKQIATDQTPNDRIWIPGSFVSGAVTPLYGSATNGVDAMVTVVTNLATAVTFTASNYAVATNGASITVTSVFTPTGGSALSALRRGKIKAYFTKW